MIRGKIMLAATFLHLFGMVGYRLLRVAILVLLMCVGWLTGEQLTGSRTGAIVGAVVLALNPYVLMIPDLDRNVMALAYAGLLFYMCHAGIGIPIVLGLLAGLTAGLGLNMLPVMFVLPLALHLGLGRRIGIQRFVLFCGVAVLSGLFWVAGQGAPPMVPRVGQGGGLSQDSVQDGRPNPQHYPTYIDKGTDDLTVGKPGRETGLQPGTDLPKDMILPGTDLPKDMILPGTDLPKDMIQSGTDLPKDMLMEPEEPEIDGFIRGGDAAYVHTFLGVTVRADRPMAWPFHDTIARGPENPYPAFLYDLLDVAKTLGVVVLSLAALGVYLCWRRSRLLVLELVLWGLPTYAVLAMQGLLIDDEQLRIIINGMLPVLLLTVVGLTGLFESGARKKKVVIAAVAAVVFAVSAGLLARLDFPVDERAEEFGGKVMEMKELPEGFALPDLRTREEALDEYSLPSVLPNYFKVIESTRYRHTETLEGSRFMDFHRPGATAVPPAPPTTVIPYPVP